MLNVTNDEGELIKQKLVYFDGEENEPIYVDIDQPVASGMGFETFFFIDGLELSCCGFSALFFFSRTNSNGTYRVVK